MTPAEIQKMEAENKAKIEASAAQGRDAARLAGEKSFDENMGKADVEEHVKIRDAATQARQYAVNARMIAELAKDNEFVGTGAGVAMTVGGILRRLGVKTDSLGDAELIKSLSTSLGLGEGQGLKGSVSDFEQRKLQDIVPSLANTPEGIAKLAEFAQRVAERRVAIAKLARSYKTLHGSDFYDKRDELSNTPIFTKDEWKSIDAIASNGAKANPAARQPTPPASQRGSAPAQAPKSGRYDPATGRIIYD
jgi:hypothetical protein